MPEWISVEVDSKEAEFIDDINHLRAAILSAFGVPGWVIGTREQVSETIREEVRKEISAIHGIEEEKKIEG